VVLDQSVDPALLGGVVATVAGTVYDGSLKTQLEDLKRQLRG
jgi:F-type H+-transporting ATPase subunit delta